MPVVCLWQYRAKRSGPISPADARRKAGCRADRMDVRRGEPFARLHIGNDEQRAAKRPAAGFAWPWFKLGISQSRLGCANRVDYAPEIPSAQARTRCLVQAQHG